MTKDQKEQVRAMRVLGMTDEEIADVLECDKRIDKGEKLFELTAEQEKAICRSLLVISTFSQAFSLFSCKKVANSAIIPAFVGLDLRSRLSNL